MTGRQVGLHLWRDSSGSWCDSRCGQRNNRGCGSHAGSAFQPVTLLSSALCGSSTWEVRWSCFFPEFSFSPGKEDPPVREANRLMLVQTVKYRPHVIANPPGPLNCFVSSLGPPIKAGKAGPEKMGLGATLFLSAM